MCTHVKHSYLAATEHFLVRPWPIGGPVGRTSWTCLGSALPAVFVHSVPSRLNFNKIYLLCTVCTWSDTANWSFFQLRNVHSYCLI